MSKYRFYVKLNNGDEYESSLLDDAEQSKSGVIELLKSAAAADIGYLKFTNSSDALVVIGADLLKSAVFRVVQQPDQQYPD